MGRALRLLVVEDSEDDYRFLVLALRRDGYDVTSTCVSSGEQLAAALEQPWDLIVTDWIMPGFGGHATLDMLSARAVATPCIVISGTPNEEAAVEALRGGALDFLSKDKPRRFVPAIERALRETEERNRIEEMKKRALELELQNRRIQEANRLKSEFLANMSHELRTPLNAIIGFAELLHDGAVPPESPQHQEFIGDILASGRHLLRLINDVLDLAKVEAGKLDFRPEPISLRRMLDEVVSITRTTAAGKRIAIAVAVEPEVDAVQLDPLRFKQIVYNYLSNALKFTPTGGQVTVRAFAAAQPGAFQLEVEDNGPGIAASDLGQLFVEFQQLDASSGKRHAGTGLGLALTKRLVEAQGGQVGVRSALGQGSTFYAMLPRTTRSGELAITVSTALPGMPAILVVEDEQVDRDLLVRVLGEAGYAVETAPTGQAALVRCRERAFDAVTLDMMLPDMSGFDLLAALRAEPTTRDVPVLVVTIVPDLKLVAGFAVHDVLRKPVEPASLVDALQRAGVVPAGPGQLQQRRA